MKEIVELCAIKASYNYYLASHRAQFEVENITQVRQNREILSAILRGLYVELKDLNKKEKDERVATQSLSYHKPGIKALTSAEQEQAKKQKELDDRLHMKAVMLFNSDPRFTITE